MLLWVEAATYRVGKVEYRWCMYYERDCRMWRCNQKLFLGDLKAFDCSPFKNEFPNFFHIKDLLVTNIIQPSFSDGEWIGGFAKGVGSCSAYMVELREAYEGLKYARRLGFSVVELDVDSSVVVQMIYKGGWGSHCGTSLVMKICRLLEME